MALLNGQTPEQIAAKVIEQVVKPVTLSLDSSTSDDLDIITKYFNRDKIQVRGEKYWEKNRDEFRKDMLTKLITDKAKTLISYMDKRERDAKMEYFLLLRSKGMAVEQAEKESGINQL